MGRIRTVKPEFFKHGDLFDLEKETGLPVRLAFAGLWTCCDREGRFKWRPRELKVDVLPYDDCDFSRVLDALASRGFVVKYASGRELFGYLPTWKEHQFINNKEPQSSIPNPPKNQEPDAIVTRESRDEDAIETRGVKEGKGKEEEGKGMEHAPPSPPYDPSADPEENIPDGLAPTQYAHFVLDSAAIPASNGLRIKTGEAIGMLARLEDCTWPEATKRMLDRMREAQRDGPFKAGFWLEEGKWKAQEAFSLGLEDE